MPRFIYNKLLTGISHYFIIDMKYELTGSELKMVILYFRLFIKKLQIFILCKSKSLNYCNCYINFEISYMIHTFSQIRLLKRGYRS